jgi:hypothetical protein
MVDSRDSAPLPPRPVFREEPYFDADDGWNAEVERRLEGYLSPTQLQEFIDERVLAALSPERLDATMERLLGRDGSYTKYRMIEIMDQGQYVVVLYGNVPRNYPGTDKPIAVHQTVLWVNETDVKPTARQPHDLFVTGAVPAPLPSDPIDVAFVDSAFNRGTGSSVTSMTLTLPTTVKPGDLIILTAQALTSGVVFTASGDLAFTKLGQNGRTGIEAAVWSRTATTLDSGQTITVTIGTSTPMSVGLMVLRPQVPIVDVVSVNQASGSSNVVMPPFTPTKNTRAIHVIQLASGAGEASVLTPPAGMTLVAAALPASASNPRSGIAFGLGAAPGTAVGNVWLNSGKHYGATFLLVLNAER